MSESFQVYLRRCNNQPPEGIKVNRDTVEIVLALARSAQHYADVDIRGDLETGLSVRLPPERSWGSERWGAHWRTYTYTPLQTGQHRAPATL